MTVLVGFLAAPAMNITMLVAAVACALLASCVVERYQRRDLESASHADDGEEEEADGEGDNELGGALP